MKDLRGIYQDQKFIKKANKFDLKHKKENLCDKTKSGKSANKWRVFKHDFLRLTHHKCPICEEKINIYDDIDHYRPKSKYDFLKCNYKNFIILCNLCNRTCKNDNFPLMENSSMAQSVEELKNEKPLLINPCVDDIYQYFYLEFKDSKGEQLLVLIPHSNLDKESYEYKRAEVTIQFYGLGDCIIGQEFKKCRDDEDVDICRRELMQRMYGTFYDLLERIDDYKKGKITEIDLKKVIDRKKKLNYGFYEFIKRQQFKVNTF